MSAKNNCTFIGNLGRDVEVRHAQSGTAIASFSVPVQSGYGENLKTTWVNCTMFGKRCEGGLMSYLKKGQLISVSGEISLNTYTNKDGIEKSSVELKVDDVALIGSKASHDASQQSSQGHGAPQSGGNNASQPDFGDVPDDSNIPF